MAFTKKEQVFWRFHIIKSQSACLETYIIKRQNTCGNETTVGLPVKKLDITISKIQEKECMGMWGTGCLKHAHNIALRL